MSLIKKMINNRKIVYLNSPKFLLNLKNDEKNRKINTKISHKNIEDLTKCLNCISQDPSMSNINRQLLNEQADHFESLNFYCGDRCFAENVLYIECVTKLLAFYVSNPKRCKIDNLRGLTVQWLEFFEQYLILMTEYYCLNKYGVEAKWEDDGSFYICKGVDKNNWQN